MTTNTNDPRQLFLVHVSKEADVLVLAKDQTDAEQIADDNSDDILDNQDTVASAVRVPFEKNFRLPWGWKDKDLVYHDGREDITVEQAGEIHRSNQPDDRQMDFFGSSGVLAKTIERITK